MRLKKIGIIMSAIMLSGTMPILASANSADTSFNFKLPGTGKYTVYNSGRLKENDTSTYVYYTNGPTTRTLFSVHGGYYTTFGSYNELKNCTIGDSAEIPVNSQRLIKQYVYEWGYSYAFLGGCNNTYPYQNISGLWSPDSVGWYPSAN